MDSIEIRFVPLDDGDTAIHAVAWRGNKRKCLVTTVSYDEKKETVLGSICAELEAEFKKDRDELEMLKKNGGLGSSE